MLIILNQHQFGTLSRNTIQNLKIYSHCLAITSQSGKATIDAYLPVFDELTDYAVDFYNAPKAKIKKLLTNGAMF